MLCQASEVVTAKLGDLPAIPHLLAPMLCMGFGQTFNAQDSPVLAAGNSLCVFVHGFEPYFYVEAPTGFGPDDCVSLSNALNVSGWLRPAQSA